MTVTLAEKLVLPKDVDSNGLKTTIQKYFEDTPITPLGSISYTDKVSKKKFKVTASKSGDKITITKVDAA